MLLLTPRPMVNRAFVYVAALAAERYGVQLHAMMVMSNHWHAVLTDPEGRLPSFLHYVHEFVAKILNCELGRYENFWSSEKTSVVTLEDETDVVDKISYLMANPVAGQLVEHGHMWPGVRRMWQSGRNELSARRPDIFYRDDGKMPESATLRFVRPPVFSELNDDAMADRLRGFVLERETSERRAIKARQGKFLGVARVRRQKVTQTPATAQKRFKLNPRVGAKNRWRRVEAIRRLKEWVDAYRAAYRAWVAGQHDVVFPAGTYALRHFAGVRCAEDGSASVCAPVEARLLTTA